MLRARIFQIALRFALCWVGSIAVGFVFFGGRIFQTELSVFQFVATGAISGLVVAAAVASGRKWSLLVFIIGFLATIAFTRSASSARLVRDAVLVVAIILAVHASLRWDRVFPRVPFGKFLLWAAGFALVHAVAVALLAIYQRAPAIVEPAMVAARIGVLIGVGVGVGYEISEFVSRRWAGRRERVA